MGQEDVDPKDWMNDEMTQIEKNITYVDGIKDIITIQKPCSNVQ